MNWHTGTINKPITQYINNIRHAPNGGQSFFNNSFTRTGQAVLRPVFGDPNVRPKTKAEVAANVAGIGAETRIVGEAGEVVERNSGRFVDVLFNRERIRVPKGVEAPRFATPQHAANAEIEKALDHGTPHEPLDGIPPSQRDPSKHWWVGPAKVGAYGGAIALGGAGVAYTAHAVGRGLGDIGSGLGQGLQDMGQGLGGGLSGTGQGLGAGLGGVASGTLSGVGQGAQSASEGVSKGAMSLLLPALLIGGGFLVFMAVKHK